MKKIPVFLFIIFLISACSPQVTVTSEVTVTLANTETQTPATIPTLYVEPTTFQEATTIVNGLEIVLGESDENGNRSITDFPYPDNIEGNQGAMDKYDAVRENLQDIFDGAQWVLTPEGNVALVDAETAYATYERVSELYDKYDFVVDWDYINYELLVGVSVVFERDHNGNNIDENAARVASDTLFRLNLRSVSLMGYEDYFGLTIGSTICAPNERKCVFAIFSELNRVSSESKRGVVTIFNSDGTSTSSFVAKNFVKDK